MARSLLDTPTYRLLRVLGRHKVMVGAELERLGLHIGHDLYLAQLWREDGLTSAELAARTGVSAPAVTKAVTGLERAGANGSGLVRRERDPADARVVRIWLTEEGRALRDPVTDLWCRAEQEVWGTLSSQERREARQAAEELLG
ncbi:MarR family winged helix-turn-helix transcriptional regulator [Actinomadura scrupuli]|uniref:MarR family winged helix-turn-helix transcriptional regulator n=1 Tax=Actinomadura scrupuli TaxID=559629 RepID=UPI003D961E54